MAIVLDTHTHLVPVQSRHLSGVRGIEWDAATEKLLVDGKTIGMKQVFRPSALIDWMDRFSIGHAWVSPPPPLFRPHLDAGVAGEWARALTAGLDEIVEPMRDRLSSVCFLPIEHPREAERIAAERLAAGNKLFTASTGGPDVFLSHADYDGLWGVLSGGGALLFLHPGESHDQRLEPFYLTNLLGNPQETGIAVAHLIFADVLFRFSGMTVLLSHGGGTVPALAGRWEQGFRTDRPGVNMSIAPPSAQLKRFHADCVTHSNATLAAARDAFGGGNIVFGSDWPFPMGLLEPDTQLAGSDPADIFGANTQRLLDAFR